jgi:DNA replication regulator SLD3
MLLPRDNLPLSFLDLNQPHGELSSSRLFDSKIKILDLEGRLGSNVHNVLLARSETSRAVYAIEREASGLYVVCKLGSWVDIEALSQGATVVCRGRIKSSKPPQGDINTAKPLITPQMYKEHKRRKTAIEEIQSICRRRSTIGSESESRPSTPAPATPRLESSDTHGDQMAGAASVAVEATKIDTVATPQTQPENSGLPGPEESMAQPTADSIFQNIRTQYFEALYHSMVCFTDTRPHFPTLLTHLRDRLPTLPRDRFRVRERLFI